MVKLWSPVSTQVSAKKDLISDRVSDLSFPRKQQELSSEEEVVQPLLRTQTIDNRFVLIKPKSCPVPKGFQSEITSSAKRLKQWLLNLPQNQLLAFDWETRGSQIFGNQDFRAVGLSFAHNLAGIYIDTSAHSRADISGLLTHIRAICKTKRLRLLAHNLYFDSSVCAFYSPTPIRESNSYFWDDGSYHMCTYLMLRYLASEQFEGQQWGLKWAQKEILQWKETNEVERDEWLINNGYITIKNSAVGESEDDEERETKLRKIKTGVDAGKSYKPNKAEMWRCPAEILGKYCILDSLSTYLLYTEILLPAFEKYETPFYKFFLYEVALEWIRSGTANYQDGIKVDLEGVKAYGETLRIEIGRLERKLYRQHKADISEINKEKLKKYDLEHVNTVRFLKPATLAPEPTKYRKNGKPSGNWIKWKVREKRLKETAPRESKLWLKYRATRKLLLRSQRVDRFDPDNRFKSYCFNPGSSDQKREILYKGVAYTRESDNKGKYFIRLPNGIELEFTDSGALPTDKAAVLALCGEGSIWNRITKTVKGLQFVDTCIRKITESNDGLLHIPMNYPGTLTGRASGSGGLNLQNQPKDELFLKHWLADVENDWFMLQSDLSSIEPHVLTECSHDKTMWKLYGPGAKKQDLYCFNGVLIGGAIGNAFSSCGYDIDNPTKEAIALCKKKYKGFRNVSKCITLSDNYGSGVKKKYRTLRILGFTFTFEDVQFLHDSFQKAYSGVKDYGKALEREWKKNNGFILNGLGIPMPIHERKLKDAVNRGTQYVGHACLMLLIYFISRALRVQKITYRWFISDFHDEVMILFHREDLEKAKEIYRLATAWSNSLLGAEVTIKFEPQVAVNLAEIKCENYKNEDEELLELLEELNS